MFFLAPPLAAPASTFSQACEAARNPKPRMPFQQAPAFIFRCGPFSRACLRPLLQKNVSKRDASPTHRKKHGKNLLLPRSGTRGFSSQLFATPLPIGRYLLLSLISGRATTPMPLAWQAAYFPANRPAPAGSWKSLTLQPCTVCLQWIIPLPQETTPPANLCFLPG